VKAIWRLALLDLQRTARDRPSFFWMIVMPLAMMWFLSGIGGGGGGGGTPRISLSVENRDDGWLSTAFLEELADESIAMQLLDPVAPPEEGSRVRTLVIPAGFTSGALAGEQQVLKLRKEPGTSDEFGAAAEVHVFRAIVRTLGRLVELQGAGELGRAAERFAELAQREDLVTLAVSTAGRGKPVPRGRAQSIPGVTTFVVLMMTLIYGAVFLTDERATGMLHRQAVLPLSRRTLFLGKLTGRLMMAAVQILILVLAGKFLFGLSWGDSPLGLGLLLASYGISVGALATLLGAVLRTQAQATSVGWIGSMVMAALGGCWWPAELMPDWMRTVAHALPTAWAMDGLHALVSFGQGLEGVLVPSAALLGFGALFTALGARFLRFEA
jgi:ABC-type multidrug transport system permease subunit